jgi:hypothetical protein
VPIKIAPAFLICFIIEAFDLEILLDSIFEPAVKRTFLTAIISLTENGIP